MAVKTNAELDAYFNTGDQPSESNFQDLIDTIQPPHVLLGDESVSLTVASHAFRTLIMGDLTADRTLTLPTPVLDTWFHIVYLAELDAADTHDLKILTATQGSEFFNGMITHLDVGADSVAVHGNGTSNDGIDILLAAGADIWLHAKSTTVWYVWGNVTGATAPTIADSVT